MGKGDKKTKKGKRFKGSYGVSRQKKSGGTHVETPKTEKPKKDKKTEKATEEAEA